MRFPLSVALCFAFGCLPSISPNASGAGPDDFGNTIRPILSDKCFLCHGPNEETREADLRLDQVQSAIDQGALAPGDPNASELIARIVSSDPDYMMPPPETGKSITAEEVSAFRDWIQAGAKYSDHWAFSPPKRPDVPRIDPALELGRVRNPIDAFVLRRSVQHGLPQAREADRTTLVRRLYLDLVGLPPSPEEVDAFVQDNSPEAYSRLVDRLFESEHFGERWARWWLDAARYADSDGYEKDKPRSVWFYRDWVIQAMNDNMPYDQFIVEQIAGDLLPNATQSQRVATGFLRNSMVNEEGGADPEQFRIEAMFDRMDAIGKAILGITTQCAQCHTHKYDPLSQREYYQMFAALDNFYDASMPAFTPEQAQQRDAVLEQIAHIEDSIKQRTPDWQSRLTKWAQDVQSRRARWRTVTPTDLPYEGQKFRVLEDGSIVSESYAPTRTTNTFSLTTTVNSITGFRIDILKHPQLPRGGPGRSIFGTGALTEFEVSIAPADQPDQKQTIKFKSAWSDVNPAKAPLPSLYRDRDPTKDKRVTGPIEFAIDGDGQTAWTTDLGPGRRNEDRVAIFIPEEPVPLTGNVVLSFTLKQNHGGWNSDDNQNYLLGRYRFSITDQAVEEFLPPKVESTLENLDWAKDDASLRTLFSYWRTLQPEFEGDNSNIEKAWQAYPETDSQLVVEATHPRPAHVLLRGDFLNRGERVEPGAPDFLGPLPQSDEPDRLRLARWLVRPDAPTTARVIVNRLWQAYFGRGIVTTPEDFGYQSSPPSHPELLDWLATELVQSGWDLRHVHRLIVESATYRQSSAMAQHHISQDPTNTWLSRGPRYRVDAELVRDIALKVSGLLDRSIGGPSVYPPAPDFLFQPPASYGPKAWHTSDEHSRYRRSLYVHTYRSVPYPPLQVFDAPKGDAACVRRERSNTPLQALVLLNEPQFVEASRALATRIMREAQGNEERIVRGFLLTLGRRPSTKESQIMTELLVKQQQRCAKAEIDVEEILGTNPVLFKQLTGTSADEAAPWVIVARTLLNLDETITKQ